MDLTEVAETVSKTEISETKEIVSQSEGTGTEQAVTEETADRTESTDATELDETTEISDTAETEISEETISETEISETTETVLQSEETETEIQEDATESESEDISRAITESLGVEKTVSPNETCDGAIDEKGKYDIYHLTLAQAGRLSINMTAYLKCNTVQIWTEDETIISSDNAKWNTNTKRSVNTYEKDLAAGRYYIKVCGDNGYDYSTGTYKMILSFTSAGENFAEPNNDFASAADITIPATIQGQIALNDEKDFFKFQVTDAGTLKMHMTSYMQYYCVLIYDASGEQVYYSGNNQWNKNLKKLEKDETADLAPGTYYMLVDGQNYHGGNYHTYTGNYNLALSFENADVTYTQADDDFASAYNLALGQEVKGHIALNDKEDIMTFTLAREEELVLNMTSYMEEYVVSFYDNSGKNEDKVSGIWNESLGYVTGQHSIKLDAGKHYLKVTGKDSTGKYTLKLAAKINIADTAISGVTDQYYTGNEINLEPVVTYQNTTLVKDTDYTLIYQNNTSIGLASVTISGTGNYSGTKTLTFNIVRRPVSKVVITGIENKTYNGSRHTQNISVSYEGETLSEDRDYTVTYKNNKNAGKATVIIEGIGNYEGSKKATFKIAAIKLSKTTASSVKNKTYTGKEIKPSVTVTWNGKTLKKGTDYKVSYKNNKNIGTATATITGMGNFSGTKKITFKIVPKKVTISKLKNSKGKKAVLTWKKDTSVTGYEIYCSTKKSSGYKLETTITKNKTTSYTDKKLTKGRTYYYKVRAYKKVNGKKIYGSYSGVKSVTIKK